ncbi:MAG: OsmC family protein [Aquamicrobium sp.]|nr:OsmC family protein [Aquamicrobium sp.]MCO5156281.1 OsmC family protein [Aquamicrobium sp.]
MPSHGAELIWKAGTQEDFLAGRYSRRHEIRFDGGASLAGSSSPSVVREPWSDPAAADPEELFVASIASCHMLWFLDFARRAGVGVRAYRDAPSGEMAKNAEGRIAVVKVTLRPHAECDADAATLEELHHKAHEACFIANSVTSDVRVEPVFEIAKV